LTRPEHCERTYTIDEFTRVGQDRNAVELRRVAIVLCFPAPGYVHQLSIAWRRYGALSADAQRHRSHCRIAYLRGPALTPSLSQKVESFTLMERDVSIRTERWLARRRRPTDIVPPSAFREPHDVEDDRSQSMSRVLAGG
jgi:hypothetical protein